VTTSPFVLRQATRDDLPLLLELIARAIAELQVPFLSAAEIEASRDIMGLDTSLIDDGTYFVVCEHARIVGCGGWSRRATLYGGSHSAGRDDTLLDPRTDPARVRAMYTDPGHARRGIGRLVLAACEQAASAEGFARTELVATLAGEPLYRACGYELAEPMSAPTRAGLAIPVLRMTKAL
jgi:GNAT superfamily N-acetyltransferase